MLALFRYALLGLGCFEFFLQNVDAQRVVSLPLRRRNHTSTLHKRDPFAISLQNYIPGSEYFVTVVVGTPGQDAELTVDTGSSDTWMFGPGSCVRSTSVCEGGDFDMSQSSTAQEITGQRGRFEIRYVSKGSGVFGSYFTDNLNIGGVTVDGLTMAVADKARFVPSGILGIGLPLNEAAVTLGEAPYPNLPEVLAAQGKIRTKSYSVYLDDFVSATGMVVFGGYDEEKFSGNIVMLPIQGDVFNGGKLSSFVVAWTSFGFADSGGDYAFAEDGGFSFGATLDTGTTLTYMPSSIYTTLANHFGIVPRGSGEPSEIDCDYAKNNPGQLVYGFGGPDGVQIIVDYDELIVPLYSGGKRATTRGGKLLCAFGIVNAGNEPLLFGQTFLRSAYVLYDLQNLQVGLAQTKFGKTKSRVYEYSGKSGRDHRITTISGTGGNIDGVAGAVSAVPTQFNLAGAPNAAGSFPAYFPTTLPMGPIGSIPISIVNDHPHTTPSSTSTHHSTHQSTHQSTHHSAPHTHTTSHSTKPSSSSSSKSHTSKSSSKTSASTSSTSPSGSPSRDDKAKHHSTAATLPGLGTAIFSLLALLGAMLLL